MTRTCLEPAAAVAARLVIAALEGRLALVEQRLHTIIGSADRLDRWLVLDHSAGVELRQRQVLRLDRYAEARLGLAGRHLRRRLGVGNGSFSGREIDLRKRQIVE